MVLMDVLELVKSDSHAVIALLVKFIIVPLHRKLYGPRCIEPGSVLPTLGVMIRIKDSKLNIDDG